MGVVVIRVESNPKKGVYLVAWCKEKYMEKKTEM